MHTYATAVLRNKLSSAPAIVEKAMFGQFLLVFLAGAMATTLPLASVRSLGVRYARYLINALVKAAIIYILDEENAQDIYITCFHKKRAGILYGHDDDQDSSWSMVFGEESPKSSGSNRIPTQTIMVESCQRRSQPASSGQAGYGSSFAGATEACKHVRTTRKGTNHFVTRISCKDCGKLLECKPTAAGIGKQNLSSGRAKSVPATVETRSAN